MLTKNENVIYLGFTVQFDFKAPFFLQISINMQIQNCIMILQTIPLWHISIYIRLRTIKIVCLSPSHCILIMIVHYATIPRNLGIKRYTKQIVFGRTTIHHKCIQHRKYLARISLNLALPFMFATNLSYLQVCLRCIFIQFLLI